MDRQLPVDELEHARDFAGLIGFCGGLVVGFCFGVSAALAYAPKNGEEMRGQLRDVSLQVKDRAGELQGRVQETIGQAKQRVQQRTSTTEEQAEESLADALAVGGEAQASLQESGSPAGI